MKLVEVRSRKDEREFLLFPVGLYKNDVNYIRPLDKDIKSVFDPKLNKNCKPDNHKRWLLRNDRGEAIGRVAAFIQLRVLKNGGQEGSMGFFECINDLQAATVLFDACRDWLSSKGMTSMDGPVNLGEREKWWGCLVDGFTEPNYCINYNPSYYKDLFEQYGFQTYFEQYTYGMPVKGTLSERYVEKSKHIFENPDFRFVNLQKRKFDEGVEAFRSIYNKAWVKHEGVSELSPGQAKALLKPLKAILDEDIAWFIFEKEKPIAFVFLLPEVNQWFKHLNGKFNALSKLRVLWMKWRKINRKMLGIAFGVIPEFQRQGMEAALVHQSRKMVDKSDRYDYFEMNWIGDFNPKMMRVAEETGGKIVKTHITYRYLFDRNVPFERHHRIE
ncbi:MAG TPA: hypothetical protein DCX54_03700 [Flavobacteriales bacterium]|nr:hypothetical protein [Flavobacteriales bacterium]